MGTQLKTQIAASMRGQILTGQIEAGQRIKEEEIAEKYGVSRGPIRDVFIELSKEGLVHAVPYKGLTVRSLPSDQVRKIYVRTRREIEKLALTRGFPNWTDDDFKAFEKCLISMRIAAEMDDLTEFVQHDMNFHRSIIGKDMIDDLMPVWTPLVSTMALQYSRHRNLMESYEEHREIFEALKAGEVKQAVQLLLKHIC